MDDAQADEVWRYELGSESHQVVRAPDLASLFESWVRIAVQDGFVRGPYDDRLRLRFDDSEEEYLRRTLGVDPFGYPVAELDDAEIERRQRASGVDPERTDDFDVWQTTSAEIASLVTRPDGETRGRAGPTLRIVGDGRQSIPSSTCADCMRSESLTCSRLKPVPSRTISTTRPTAS